MSKSYEAPMAICMKLVRAIEEGRHNMASLRDLLSDGEERMSVRSIRRYLSRIEQAGFPYIYDRQTDIYRFPDGFSATKVTLSSDELQALVALRAVAVGLGGLFGDEILKATEKMSSLAGTREATALTKPNLVLKMPELELSAETEQHYNALMRAERARRTVEMEYQNKYGTPSKREIDPYGFIASNGRLYAIAHDHRTSQIRVFALDNVESVRFTGKSFVKASSFDLANFARESITGVYDGSPLNAIVRFSKIVAKAAVLSRVADPEVLATNEDGSVDLLYRKANRDELLRWLLQWGPEAQVLEPEEVRQQAAELLRVMLERYQKDDVA